MLAFIWVFGVLGVHVVALRRWSSPASAIVIAQEDVPTGSLTGSSGSCQISVIGYRCSRRTASEDPRHQRKWNAMWHSSPLTPVAEVPTTSSGHWLARQQHAVRRAGPLRS